MKRFVSYNPTAKEIHCIFVTDEDYASEQERLTKTSCDDTEKMYIAHLLLLRGQNKESKATLETIEDEKYRLFCINELYALWAKRADGAV